MFLSYLGLLSWFRDDLRLLNELTPLRPSTKDTSDGVNDPCKALVELKLLDERISKRPRGHEAEQQDYRQEDDTRRV